MTADASVWRRPFLKLPRDHEFRGLGQYFVTRLEWGKGGQRLGLQLGELHARRIDAEQRDERALAGLGVLAGRLADKRRIAFHVENVVRELERGAQRVAIGAQRRDVRLRTPRPVCRRPRSQT